MNANQNSGLVGTRPAVECAYCGKQTNEYGTHGPENKIACYQCCASIDVEYMRKHGCITMYLVEDGTNSDGMGVDRVRRTHYVTNWPGTLRIRIPHSLKKSRHNFARVRYDFWFPFEGYWWHGYQIGDNTQIARCKRTKEKVK